MKCQNFRCMNFEKRCQRQADQAQHAAEHGRQRHERVERYRLAVLRTAVHERQCQADQARRAAERERLRLERLERHRLAAEHELQRLAILRTADRAPAPCAMMIKLSVLLSMHASASSASTASSATA